MRLYIHLPFCRKKCHYCHFYTVPDREEEKLRLLEALQREIVWRKEFMRGKTLLSLYLGGGTPFLFGPQHLESLLLFLQKRVSFEDSSIEITLEANPESVDSSLLADYYSLGINRLSIGVQSFDCRLLQKLSREHTVQQSLYCIEEAHRIGFNNLSIDLMYDLPSQTLEEWKLSLKQSVALPIDHISLYNLTIEPRTRFFREKKRIEQELPREEDSAQMYSYAMDFLPQYGFRQYEISAFARAGKESQHNLGYWMGDSFIGLGPSAFSYWQGNRSQNVCHLSTYCTRLQQGQLPVDFSEKLAPDAQIRELFVIQLRILQGVHIPSFEKQHGRLEKSTVQTLHQLQSEGMVDFSAERVSLTLRGKMFYDSVAAHLI